MAERIEQGCPEQAVATRPRRVGAFAIYRRLAAAAIASQMQDRLAFVLQTFIGFAVNGVEFVAIAFLFHRFGAIEGWRLPEIALLYGLVQVAFACADTISGGFDNFGNLVRSGEFDRLLLRPRSSALMVISTDLQLRRVGRFTQGAAVLAWGATQGVVTWTPARAALALASIASGTCVFLGVFVIQATIAFFTVESLEVMNVLTYGGVEQGQYPLSIYRTPFQVFFAAIVPIACVNYFPLHAILDRPEVLGTPAWFHWIAPLAGPVFLALALKAWRLGERRYSSTGS